MTFSRFQLVSLTLISALAVSLSACGSTGGGGDATSETGGDGDPSGDGDGDEDPSGDGDGDSSGDGDGDGDPQVPPCPYTPVSGDAALGFELVGEGFDRPVLALGHPTEPDRLYVVEQGGHVKVLAPGETQAPSDADAFLFVDVQNADATQIGPEMGLLGFAFHPDFPDDPRVYVNYNPAVGSRTVVSEFTVSATTGKAEGERVILELHQPASNHNGGMIAFGPDRMLYIGMGDGGAADDAFNTGRDGEVLLAKILRIDPEPTGTANRSPISCKQSSCDDYGPFDYGIPADNPFVGDAGVADEVYAWGFRNPWRFFFDGDDLWVADVGQNAYEEVALVQAGDDHGWSDMEGFHCFGGANCDELTTPNGVNADGMTMPVVEYMHTTDPFRCSVTGGAVYRSCQVPAWEGGYLFADYCSSEIFGIKWDGSAVTGFNSQGGGALTSLFENVLGYGSNAWGDVYFTTVVVGGFGITDGRVYRAVPN